MVGGFIHHIEDADSPRFAVSTDPADDVSLAPWLAGQDSTIPKSPNISLRTGTGVDRFEGLEVGKDLLV